VRDGAVTVRELGRGDLRRAAEFCERARVTDAAIEPFGDRLAPLAQGPRALLDLWRVAEDDGGALQGIAFAVSREARHHSNLGDASADVYVTVAPSIRRRGVGAALCEPLVRWSMRERATLRARVRDDAVPGRAFLTALKFRERSAQLSLTWATRPIHASTADDLRVRQMCADEARAELAGLCNDAWADAPEAFATRPDDLAQLFAHDARMVLVAETAGCAVGYLSGVWIGPTFAIEEVAVLPRSRRRGVGRALLATALRDAASAILSVAESNLAARALYESIGFTQSRRHLIYELRHG
jgi:ribosomal protein S18 acetylase RimI-like enzyme